MGKQNTKGKFPAKSKRRETSETEAPAARSTLSGTVSEPELTILQLRPKNNYADWEKNNKSYFAITFGKHGEFFETMKPYRPPMPKRPAVRARAGAAASAAAGSEADSSSATTRGPSTRSRGSDAPLGASSSSSQATAQGERETGPRRSQVERLHGADDDSSSSSDSDNESVYSDNHDDEDIVDSEEAATYIYNKRLDNKVKDELYYVKSKPQMYAALLRSLGSEAEATVRTSSKFEQADRDKDEVLLRKICHKKLRQYSTARGVTKEIKSAKTLYQIHQFGNEHTADYYERFKREVDAYETYMGESLSEARTAALFTEGLHGGRYGTMKIEIENGVTKRMKTLDKAYKQAMKRVIPSSIEGGRTHGILASNYVASGKQDPKTDDKKKSEKKEDKGKQDHKKQSGNGGGKKGNKFACTTCKLLGEENFDHRAYECPNESRALSLVKEATMFTIEDEHDSPVHRPKASSNWVFADIAATYASVEQLLRKDEIVWDSGTTINLFHNADLLDGEMKDASLEGISTYGGKAAAAKQGTYKGMLTYVIPNGPANLMSHGYVKDHGGRVEIDDEADLYTVYLPCGDVMKFVARRDLGHLYVYTPEHHVYATVKERLKLYTKREQRKAIQARAAVPNLGFPSDKDYASLLNGNLARNMPVTSADVYRAHRIFGKDVPSYMGKTSRKTAPKIDLEKVEAVIDKRVTLGMDVFFVNQGGYMLSVSSFRYKFVTYMGIRNKTMKNDPSTFFFHVRHHISAYRSKGFSVNMVRVDNEQAFVAIKASVEDMGVTYSILYGSKVEECERAIRPIKERHRAYVFHIPFPITHRMEVFLVLNCVRLLNAFPTHGDGYDGIPPIEIFRGYRLDWRIDFPVAYGDVCLVPSEVNDMESGTSKSRGEMAIAMLPHGNSSGDITFINLRTMDKLVRNRFTVIPTPEYVITYLKDHVGNNVAAMRRHPVYRNMKGEIIDDDPPPLEQQQIIEAAEPVIAVNREPLQNANEQEGEEILPNVPEMAEPAYEQAPVEQEPLPVSEVAQAHEPVRDDPAQDVELEVGDHPDAPVLNIEDVRQRYPQRSNRTTWRERSYFATRAATRPDVKVNKLLNAEPRARLKAMAKEIHGIAILKKGFVPVSYNRLSYRQLKGVISSQLFTKAKFSPDGEFEKWKARLVAGGHMQNREEYTYSETSSPTVSATSILTVASIAAKEGRKTATIDFTAAYLNAKMGDEREILMRLSKESSKVLCLLVPAYREFVREDGTMIVKLTKALYGCLESAKLWYDSICGTLESDGFVRNPKEPCVFNKDVGGKQLTVCVYVDDLFVTCESEEAILELVNILKKKYSDMTHTVSNRLKYVGMILDFTTPGELKISMPSCVDTIIHDLEVTSDAPTPAGADLFMNRASDERLDPEKADLLHSIVMKMQYLAKRARPDILLPVVYLSSRVSKSTTADWRKLLRIARYLRGTRDLTLRVKPSSGLLSVHAFIDASFAVHHDFKSHTGAVITFGLGCIFFKSTKQKLNTKSSTEAELVAISDALTTIIWIRDFLIGQGYDVGPAVVYQDNMSTIKMVENGRGTAERSRHINIKFFFVSDRVEKGEIEIKYMPTNEMLADMFTKPLQGDQFRYLRDSVMGHVPTVDPI